MLELPKRKKNRIQDFDYGKVGAYFVTLCIENRKPVLWNMDAVGAATCRPQSVALSHLGETIDIAINQIPTHYSNVKVDHYCIMPNHIHMILSIMPDESGRQIAAPTISTIIGNMKRWVSMKIGYSIWQKSFYDHIIRDCDDYNVRVKYIHENPIRWYYDELYTKP